LDFINYKNNYIIRNYWSELFNNEERQKDSKLDYAIKKRETRKMKFINEHLNTEIVFDKNMLTEFDLNDTDVFIIDSNVFRLYKNLFKPIKDQSRIFIYEANEHAKNNDSLKKIYKFLNTNNVKRNNIIIGIGGGITTDIAAFAASTFKRGCRLILVPTTLLGMVDASIGGKTGINFENIKNGIGSFYPAEKVIINSDFLKTQIKADYKDGLVEIIKMSFLSHSNLYKILYDEQNIEEIIKEAIRTKLELCQKDLHDKSSRRLLNLGHTFGHVLESISNYEISHGTAVAIGIRAASRFSLQKRFIDDKAYINIISRMNKYELPKSFSRKYLALLLEQGISKLKQDKKADDKINLILFKDLDELFIFQTDKYKEIINTLKEFTDV